MSKLDEAQAEHALMIEGVNVSRSIVEGLGGRPLLLDALGAVLALHRPTTVDGSTDVLCQHCVYPCDDWPCATYEAVSAPLKRLS